MARRPDDRPEAVLVLAPIGADARVAAELLEVAGAAGVICESMTGLVQAMTPATSALVIASEALEDGGAEELAEVLAHQPAWSDVPVILLTLATSDVLPPAVDLLINSAGSISLLDRPFPSASFVSLVKVALRARRRQFQVKRLLESERLARARAASESRRADAHQRDLRNSEERFRLIADSIPQLAWMADPEGQLFWFNERWYEFAAADREDPKSGVSSWLAAQDPDYLPLAQQRWRASLASGHPFDMELPLRRHDGEIRWFLTRAVPALGGDGKPTMWFGTSTDITEHRQTAQALRQSEERLLLAVETAQLGLWTLDPVHQRLLCSDAFREQIGRGGHAVNYDEFWSAVHADDREALAQRISDAIDSANVLAAEYRVLTPSGEVRWILARARPVPSDGGSFVQLLGVSLEITERKETEQRREAALTAERAARSQAERVARMKDEFLATLSHELRTPLNAVLGWAEVMQRTRPGSTDFEHGLAAITRNARLQAQLIEDLLDTSRIVSGTLALDMTDVDPAEIVDAAIDSVRPSANARDITIARTYQPGLRVRGDRRRLLQVVWNLLTNAVKFSKMHSTIRVILAANDGKVLLEVQDEGHGIDAEFLPYLFERFRQQDSSRTRRSGGLGLGLSIVRHLVQLHGGTVSGASEGPGKGATFRVALPALPAARATATINREVSPEPQFDALAGARILAVDDEPDSRELLARILRERQAIVLLASSAEEALKSVREHAPDLIVSDIGMPGRDGFELIADVRRLSGAAAKTPAIALTAFARAEDRDMALASGFQRHLGKPIDSFALLNACAELIAAPTRVRASEHAAPSSLS